VDKLLTEEHKHTGMIELVVK